MKNATLVLPARFLCNMCIDTCCESDLYKCTKPDDNLLPLEGVRDAKNLSEFKHISVIQVVIKEALLLWKEDIKMNSIYYLG